MVNNSSDLSGDSASSSSFAMLNTVFLLTVSSLPSVTVDRPVGAGTAEEGGCSVLPFGVQTFPSVLSATSATTCVDELSAFDAGCGLRLSCSI